MSAQGMLLSEFSEEVDRRGIILRDLGCFKNEIGEGWYWRANHTTLRKDMILSSSYADTLMELFDKILKANT